MASRSFLAGGHIELDAHLDPFQILSQRPIRYQIPEYGIEDLAITAAATLERDPGDKLGHAIDDNERGLKDTVRVNPNEITEIAVRFTTYSGRYMYHCHILEHEDRDMMRPSSPRPPISCRSWPDRPQATTGLGVHMVRRPDDQHDPPFEGFRIVMVDLEGDLVLSVRDTGPQVLFGEGVLEGVDDRLSCSLYRTGNTVGPNRPV